jgi:putative heme iron utilization protein
MAPVSPDRHGLEDARFRGGQLGFVHPRHRPALQRPTAQTQLHQPQPRTKHAAGMARAAHTSLDDVVLVLSARSVRMRRVQRMLTVLWMMRTWRRLGTAMSTRTLVLAVQGRGMLRGR